MAFSSKVALPFLHVLLDCGIDFLGHYLLRAVGCKCQVTTLWPELINTASLFAPVYPAEGRENEEWFKVGSVPAELKGGMVQGGLSTC